jgi:hypothetical protein
VRNEANVKLVVLVGEHSVLCGCKYPGCTAQEEIVVAPENIGKGLNELVR